VEINAAFPVTSPGIVSIISFERKEDVIELMCAIYPILMHVVYSGIRPYTGKDVIAKDANFRKIKRFLD
jgi:hypothetical protein